MTLQPSLGRIIGQESGDWLILGMHWNVPPAAMLVLGLTVAVPVCALFMRDAQSIVGLLLSSGRPMRPLFAYWLLVLPGALLLLAYLAAFSPWRTASIAMALGSILGVPLLSIPAEFFNRLRNSPSAHPSRGVFTAAPGFRVSRWSSVLAAFALAVAWTFGPIIEWRRGVAVASPDPDDYANAAQRITLDLDMTGAGTARLDVISQPRAGAGAPFVRRVTRALAETGPSHEGAVQLTEFIAHWNLDDARVLSVARPVRQGNTWAWSAELQYMADSIMIRLWPLTRIPESNISSLRIGGPVVATRTNTGSTRDGPLVWTRSPQMTGIDSFHVTIR
jgi:hypothetical protein